MRKRPMREPEDLPTFDLAFLAERSPVPACGSSHTQSCTTLLPRCSTRSLVAVCTNVEPDDGRLAAFLCCAILPVRIRGEFHVGALLPDAAMGSRERTADNL